VHARNISDNNLAQEETPHSENTKMRVSKRKLKFFSIFPVFTKVASDCKKIYMYFHADGSSLKEERNPSDMACVQK
jgi:hypothetical protein